MNNENQKKIKFIQASFFDHFFTFDLAGARIIYINASGIKLPITKDIVNSNNMKYLQMKMMRASNISGV
jgi:hypothetical protein